MRSSPRRLVRWPHCCWLRLPAAAQLPKDPAERAKVIAQIFAANARQLTLFDREGKEVSVVGPRDLYNQPVLSPDGKRVAVIKADLDKETNDLWVFDVATGKGTQITSSQAREAATSPAWSPDGSQVAYVALRDGPLRSVSKSFDRRRRRGAPVPESRRPDDAHRLVTGRTFPDLLLDRPFRRHLVRVAAQRGRRAKADRSLPQQVSAAGAAPFSRQPLPRLRVERVGKK